ncbi:hypothetical protein BT93_E0052 [Corymbia citriodora subsp. variegata]|nr:hypothetical protein BT93_E0052 [Corymbia citriodora subsp. variegata]
MADSGRSRTIPNGWIFKPKVRRGSDASHYYCPATGQIFSTYKALMHYVEYAKRAKVSIYAPDFDTESSGKRKGRLRTKTQVCKLMTRGRVPSKGIKAASAALEQLPSDIGQIMVPKSGISGKLPSKSWEEACLPDSKEVLPAVGQTKVPCKRTEAGPAALKQLPSNVGQSKVLKCGIVEECHPKGWKEECLADPEEVFPAVNNIKVYRKRSKAGSATLKQLPSDVGQSKVLKVGIGGEFHPEGWKEECTGNQEEVFPAVDITKVYRKRTLAGSAAPKQLPSDVGQSKALKVGIGGEFHPEGWKEECTGNQEEVFPAVDITKVYRKRTLAGSAAPKQLPSDVGRSKVLKSGIGGEFPPKGWKEACPVDPEEVFPAIDQTKVTPKRTQAGSAALKQHPSDVGQSKVLKFGIGRELPPKVRKEACPADLKELFPAVDQTKISCKRTQAGSAALKQHPSDVGQNKALKFGIGGGFPPKGWKEECLADLDEAFPAVDGTKVYRKRTQAGSATPKQLPSDVGQNKVLKFGIGREFPSEGWKEACPVDPEEVFPAVNQTKVTRERMQAGSAAPKQHPLDVGQDKVLKFGIGGEFPPEGWKEACLADPEEVFPAVDRTKYTRKRTQAGSAALKQLPSAVGQIKVPKFGISENIPCKRWKEACPVDAKELCPDVYQTKVPTIAMEAGFPPERREEACLPDLKELSPGDEPSGFRKLTLGVEYPPKRLREGYLQLSPAVDQTSIWNTPIREKIPPRRKNYCPPAINQLSLGQSSKLGAINESEVNIGSMDMTPMGDFDGVQQYTPLEGDSSETNHDWAFEANIFPFQAGFEVGDEPTISALDSSFQYYMEPSRPYIEHQYQRRDRNKSTRPTVGQLRRKGT